MEILNNDIRKIEDLEDGSSVYEVGPQISNNDDDVNDFSKNLALSMSEASLKRLSSYLVDSIKEDIESRKEWLTSVERVKTYLGFTLEDLKKIPFKESTRTFDTTLSTALIRFYATTRSELLHQSGPAGFRIIKNNSNLESFNIDGINNAALQKEGERRRDALNNYLTLKDKGYYSDFEKFLLYLGLYGSGFKKVYFDKLLNRPISRFILPEDFIVNGDCTSILESTRITHVLHLSKREILLNQRNGIYRNIELKHLKALDNSTDDDEDALASKNKDGIDRNIYTKRSLSPIYEIHTYIDLEEFSDSSMSGAENNVPLPYVIAIDKISMEILYIRKNWDATDKERVAINYFVQYNYIPGFGIYGIGLAHLIGSNAISLTTLLRQLIDAGKFRNLPGGLRAKGFGQQQNDIIVGPGEWIEVDTGGLSLEAGFMRLPYPEPSQVLRELRLELVDQCNKLGSTSEMGMMDSREDIATGTAEMFLEVNNRIQSVVLRSIHTSLSEELQLLDKFLNSDTNLNDLVKIIPVSDPSMNSSVQRMMKGRATFESAMLAPELHNMTEVFKLKYEAQGLDQETINKILKPDPEKEEKDILPLDPISEYMNILLGKPVTAAVWQNHPAHILCLGVFSQRSEIQDKPEAMGALRALITEHQTFQYLIEMQELLGFELPPLEQLQDPQIQNAIALGLAQQLNDSGATENQQQQQPPPDPNAVWLAEVQAREAEIAAKERIANIRAETDIFKAQLNFEKEKAKIESNEDIAQLKSETELTK